ncbi:MAG: lysophospholipid acyltransferase family protein [Nitrospirae bacterium]|nr:lysophospholipid acyltransferase family protein [Nitrospirota bacterium]
MADNSHKNNVFRLEIPSNGHLNPIIGPIIRAALERLMSFHLLNKLYEELTEREGGCFITKTLQALDVKYEISEEDIRRIPASGPAVVVANHPFGGIEGMIIASILRMVRPDVRIMANYLLSYIPDIADMFFFVDPFKKKDSYRMNVKSLRETVLWVKQGGMLVVFPAGEVSHVDLQKREVTDPKWDTSVARIIRKTASPALPVYFDGSNGILFNLAGLIHPLLRTAMLPHEFLNKAKKTIRVKIGNLVSFNRLCKIESGEAVMDYLRLRTYLLANGTELRRKRRFPLGIPFNLPKGLSEGTPEMTPIAPAENPDVMRGEIAALPEEQILARHGQYTAASAWSWQIPSILREIGRLREITFRAGNEGTGKAADLDQFDSHYLHLFIWNSDKNEIVGAYRFGKTDEILMKQGIKGLYTSTLFKYGEQFLDKISPALEMGRSFVRQEYQRSYLPLLLLWKGIGQIVSSNPKYRYLFGPVSINKDYSGASAQLIVSFLKMTSYIPSLARYIRPKTPLRPEPVTGWDTGTALSFVRDIDDISELIAAIGDSDCVAHGQSPTELTPPKGVPILLRQYLRLGGKLIGFNIDHSFGDCLDGLILVDLTLTEPALLTRYMGKEGIDAFYKYHGKAVAPALSA